MLYQLSGLVTTAKNIGFPKSFADGICETSTSLSSSRLAGIPYLGPTNVNPSDIHVTHALRNFPRSLNSLIQYYNALFLNPNDGTSLSGTPKSRPSYLPN